MLSADAQLALARGESREPIEQELKALLERVNAGLESHEQLDFLVVVKDQWTMENGFLTPTMKIRRNVIEARYLPQLERWAQSRSPVIWEQ
jgi:long-subunit acyl-CoA synthetase (AMP-forming)